MLIDGILIVFLFLGYVDKWITVIWSVVEKYVIGCLYMSAMINNLILYVDSELIFADLLKWNFPMYYWIHYDVASSGMIYFRATWLENQPLFHLVAVRIGLSTFSGRFLKNINFPPPPNLPHVFIYIVFVLENLGDCGFCSQHFIYTRKTFMVEGR